MVNGPFSQKLCFFWRKYIILFPFIFFQFGGFFWFLENPNKMSKSYKSDKKFN